MIPTLQLALHDLNMFVMGLVGPPGMGQPGGGAPALIPPIDNGNGGVIPPATQNQSPGLFCGWSMFVIYGIIILFMYLVLFRPQRKREKKMKEMQATITVGDNIVTNAGFFGKVMDVGEDCFVIEFGTNRGVRIPVAKSEVVGIRTPVLTPASKEPS